jgi:polyphosphate kinase
MAGLSQRLRVVPRATATRPGRRQARPEAELADPALYLNREMSWLAFNERVLDQARSESHPLLERVKFLAIAANNLDEFFMVRVAALARDHRAGVSELSPDGLAIGQQLTLVRARATAMLDELAECWSHTLRPLLEGQRITIVDPPDFTDADEVLLEHYFSADACPVLTPLAFDPGHPFPYISNRSKNLAVVVEHRGRIKFARVKVPDVLPRFVALPAERDQGDRLALLEDVVRLYLSQLFPGVTVTSAHLFRVLRDTDLVVAPDESEDLMAMVDRSLKEQRRGALSLLEVEDGTPSRVLDTLIENFEIGRRVVVRSAGRMGLADWIALARLRRPGLKDRPFAPTVLWRRGEPEIFDEIKYRDQLVHHPFDSFSTVEAFVDAAVDDPSVVAIKMTLYRIGANSPLVDRLITAAHRGKQVAVLVELKARFDERSNMEWATRLEEAGVHVVHGVQDLKTHCKICLVVRQEEDGVRRYVHVATGNYNRATAHVYTDLGLFTANPRIVADVSELFNYLTGYSNQTDYRELLVGPLALRRRFAKLVAREITHARNGRPARIIIKCNSVCDSAIIRLLYRASQAGVVIDLIVRGICALRPGVPGVSETIRVRSIVGRLLEHSRIWFFENGGKPESYIGSADLMERNLNTRVEVVCPVLDPGLGEYVRHVILEAYLRDNVRATILTAEGTYEPADPGDAPPIDAQTLLMSRKQRERLAAET